MFAASANPKTTPVTSAPDAQRVAEQMLAIKELLEIPFLYAGGDSYKLVEYFLEHGPGVNFKVDISKFGSALKEILDQEYLYEQYEEAIVGSYVQVGLKNGAIDLLVQLLTENSKLLIFFHKQLALNILQPANAGYCQVLENHNKVKSAPGSLKVKAAKTAADAKVAAAADAKGTEAGDQPYEASHDRVRRENEELRQKAERALARAKAEKVTPADLAELDEELRASKARLSQSARVGLAVNNQKIGRGGMLPSAYGTLVAPLKQQGILTGNEKTERARGVTISELNAEISRLNTPAQERLAFIENELRLCREQLNIQMLEAQKKLFQELLKGKAANQATIVVLRKAVEQAEDNYNALYEAHASLKELQSSALTNKDELDRFKQEKGHNPYRLNKIAMAEERARESEIKALTFGVDILQKQRALQQKRLNQAGLDLVTEELRLAQQQIKALHPGASFAVPAHVDAKSAIPAVLEFTNAAAAAAAGAGRGAAPATEHLPEDAIEVSSDTPERFDVLPWLRIFDSRYKTSLLAEFDSKKVGEQRAELLLDSAKHTILSWGCDNPKKVRDFCRLIQVINVILNHVEKYGVSAEELCFFLNYFPKQSSEKICYLMHGHLRAMLSQLPKEQVPAFQDAIASIPMTNPLMHPYLTEELLKQVLTHADANDVKNYSAIANQFKEKIKLVLDNPHNVPVKKKMYNDLLLEIIFADKSETVHFWQKKSPALAWLRQSVVELGVFAEQGVTSVDQLLAHAEQIHGKKAGAAAVATKKV